MAKQKLSPAAKKAKAIRDKKAAMTPDRRAKKAENQRKRRAATKLVKIYVVKIMTTKRKSLFL